ncbi:MAG: hypothetical protein AVDCRST_MAG85-3890 [uncultured Solirubrobacteraceae bacterium]|uniref:ABM domain-containing protein n=1 Tax=uncultured Solirubrobacteraceae bacterium TaxID=1162706 RepID=A0A6J4TWQ0_9ACTN|nr:MAG: hypothetical protein AVDCRST_MAG85-3890 [uncultured Solirubrobacteraceae bacterium]
MSVLVHAEVHGLAGRAKELRDVLLQHAAGLARMDGNAGATVYEPVGTELGEYVLDVWWRDEAAMRAHYGTGEYARYRDAVGELLARPSDVMVHVVERSYHPTDDPAHDPARQG